MGERGEAQMQRIPMGSTCCSELRGRAWDIVAQLHPETPRVFSVISDEHLVSSYLEYFEHRTETIQAWHVDCPGAT